MSVPRWLRHAVMPLALLCFGLVCYADDTLVVPSQPLKVRVTLEELACEALTGHYFDQLYIGTTIYTSGGQFDYQRHPAYPHHWPLRAGMRVQHQPLWQGQLADGQTFVLTMALLEQDFSVFNPDDLLGLVKLTLHRSGRQLLATWMVPNRIAPPDLDEQGRGLYALFVTAAGRYHLRLLLVTDAEPLHAPNITTPSAG